MIGPGVNKRKNNTKRYSLAQCRNGSSHVGKSITPMRGILDTDQTNLSKHYTCDLFNEYLVNFCSWGLENEHIHSLGLCIIKLTWNAGEA